MEDRVVERRVWGELKAEIVVRANGNDLAWAGR